MKEIFILLHGKLEVPTDIRNSKSENTKNSGGSGLNIRTNAGLKCDRTRFPEEWAFSVQYYTPSNVRITKNNPSGNFLTIYWIQAQYMLLLGEQVLTIFLCINRVRLNWNFIVNDVQSATYSSHGAPCPARDLFPWLNTRVKVHISLWTTREYPKRHFRYLSDSGDTFLPLIRANASPKWYAF